MSTVVGYPLGQTGLASGSSQSAPYQPVGANDLPSGTGGFTPAQVAAVAPVVPNFDLTPTAAAANALANTQAIQAALDKGGRVYVGGVGVAYVSNSSLAIGDNTWLEVSPALRLKQFAASGAGSNMLVTKNYKSGVWTNVTPAYTAGSLRLPINWGVPHGLRVGDYVCLRGATPTQFIGVFPVVAVADANNFTVALLRVPTGAPTGTMQALKAHQNIIVRGGIWDYNKTLVGYNPVDQVGTFAIILAYGVNLWAHDTQHADAAKYALCLAAVASSGWTNLIGEGKSDGVKVYGPAFGIKGHGIHGVWADDTFSLQTREPNAYAPYRFSQGSIIGGEFTGLNAASTVMQFSVYPDDIHEMDDIEIEGAAGQTSGFFVQMGSSEPDFAFASCNLGSITFRNLQFRRGLDTLTFGMFFAQSPKIRKLRFENCGSAGGGFASGANQEIKLNGQVDTVEVVGGTFDGLRFTCTSTFVSKLVKGSGATAKGVTAFFDFSPSSIDEVIADACVQEYDATLGGQQRLIVCGTGVKYAEARNCNSPTSAHSVILVPGGVTSNPQVVLTGCTVNGNSGINAQASARITVRDNVCNNVFNGLMRLETVGQIFEVRGGGNILNGSSVALARPSAATIRALSFDQPLDASLLDHGTAGTYWNNSQSTYTLFTVSGITTAPAVGDTYTNNAVTYTVTAVSVTGGAGYIACTGSGAPTASGTLTRATGAGDATIAFSANARGVGQYARGQTAINRLAA